MRIAVYGGGNLGHVLSGLLSAQGHEVRVFVSTEERAERWRKGIDEVGGILVHFPDGSRKIGRPAVVTADVERVVCGSEIVLVTVPAFVHRQPWRRSSRSSPATPISGPSRLEVASTGRRSTSSPILAPGRSCSE